VTLDDVVTAVCDLPEMEGEGNAGSLVQRAAVLNILQSYAYALAAREIPDPTDAIDAWRRARNED
jgi:hypothetical protein